MNFNIRNMARVGPNPSKYPICTGGIASTGVISTSQSAIGRSDCSVNRLSAVAVARAIALDPPLILADEPTAHLDFVQVEEVLRLLRELTTGEHIVVVATHDTRILPLADRVIELVAPFASTDREPETVCLTRGSVLFEQGSIGDLIYIVSDGELEIALECSGGAEELLRVVAPGDYVGEFGPLFRMPRSATVRARTDATVTGYTVQAFRRLFETSTERHVIDHHEIDTEQETPRMTTAISGMPRY